MLQKLQGSYKLLVMQRSAGHRKILALHILYEYYLAILRPDESIKKSVSIQPEAL